MNARCWGAKLFGAVANAISLSLIHILLNVIFGGFLYGLCIAIALRGNASTGGTDFIALYVSNKTGRSIWEYVFAGNVVILCIFGYMFGWLYAGYSILFQFISTKTISSFHHRYERVTLQITTAHAEEIMKAYIGSYRHGISCVDAIGGYSHQKMNLLHTVVSSYEVSDIVQLMRQQDPHVIINMVKMCIRDSLCNQRDFCNDTIRQCI